MAYVYGSGLYYKKSALQVDDLLLINTTQGWSGHLIEGADPDTYLEHPGFGAIPAGRGIDYQVPRTVATGTEEAKEIFRLSEIHKDTIWQNFWSIPRALGHVRFYLGIPSTDHGIDLGNEVDGGFQAALANQPFYGWQFHGFQTLRGKETDVGSWFQLPNERVEFAFKNPRSGPPVGNMNPTWIIRPLLVRHLDPNHPDDAQVLYDAMSGDGRVISPHRVIKYTHKRYPLPFTNAVQGVWGVPAFSWDGFDGIVKQSNARLSEVASAGTRPIRVGGGY